MHGAWRAVQGRRGPGGLTRACGEGERAGEPRWRGRGGGRGRGAGAGRTARAFCKYGVRYSATRSVSTAMSMVAMPGGGPSLPERMCEVAVSLSVM